MRVLLSHSPPCPLVSIQDTTAFVWQPAFGVHSALQGNSSFLFSIHSPVPHLLKYHPPPPVMLLNATTSIQSEKLRERLKPRSSQATSVIDTDCLATPLSLSTRLGPFDVAFASLFLCHPVIHCLDLSVFMPFVMPPNLLS